MTPTKPQPGHSASGVYLITGGTGTLGRALIERLLSTPDTIIRLYARGEAKHEDIQRLYPELTKPGGRIRNIIGDVRDLDHLRYAARGADYVVHAAAQKRVDLAEYNAPDVIATNISGTVNACRAAVDAGVRDFVLVSSDKATSPLNIYGKSKAVAESIVQTANHWSGNSRTRFYAVRYGNVIGSRGSIAGKIKHWQDSGEAPQITHLDMTRFWLTIDDAVNLIETAVASGFNGVPSGCILVPMAKALLVTEFFNAVLDDEMDRNSFKVVGIRPGEKLHESLLSDDEARLGVGMLSTDHDFVRTSMDLIVVPPSIGIGGQPGPVAWATKRTRGLYSNTEIDATDDTRLKIRRATMENHDG